MVTVAKRLFLALSSLCLLLLLWPTSSALLRAQLSTDDHLAEPGFWPTQISASRKDFVGSAACATCHAAIVATQARTAMGGTAMHAAGSDILRSHSTLNFAFDKLRYEIKSTPTQNTYTITNTANAQSQSAILAWAFGTGRVGQSYLFKKEDGKFYEARVTYFDSLEALHFTPDRALASAPASLDQAMDRPVELTEIQRCFACHSTAPNIAGQFDEANLVPGVTCEACHGPGTKHVAAMQSAKIAGIAPNPEGTIFNAAELSPADAVDYCGSCHATWWDVKLSGVKGVSNAKSQPYRLEGSKCWRKGDVRLTCTACHDPHKPLETDIVTYDKNCLNCHPTAPPDHSNPSPTNPATNAPAGSHDAAVPAPKSCPVATKNCATCHMPKVYLPEMHYNFTDHRIRIARAGEPYPE